MRISWITARLVWPSFVLLQGAHTFTFGRRRPVAFTENAEPLLSPRSIERTTLTRRSRLQQEASSVSQQQQQDCRTLDVKDAVLQTLRSLPIAANEYAETFGLGPAEAAFYGLFLSLRKSNIPLLGLTGRPFTLKHAEIELAWNQPTTWPGFFTMTDLEKAVSDDFLDAARGSTDNRKGWKITDVSIPRGESFEEARMSFDDVQSALAKGTVIMNAAGAHIPKLAGPCLAVTDATLLPCALNLYVTAPGQKTSAPPHTDKQDVCVVQTTGCKHWKVYAPPDPSIKPGADLFARGKGDDNLPLYSLRETSELLLETTLHPGDVLFVPAGFPHTTSTTTTVVQSSSSSSSSETDRTTTNEEKQQQNKNKNNNDETSIHLTLGMDHHIWELDYLSVRRLAYRRAGVSDTALQQQADATTAEHHTNPYVGRVNQLSYTLLCDIMAELPLGLLDADNNNNNSSEEMVDRVANEAARIATEIDSDCALDDDLWKATVRRIRQQGMELLDIHRDMYLAALEEGRTREAENAMTAHISSSASSQRGVVMSPERMQRLSLFRVKRFYDQINDSKERLKEWSLSGVANNMSPTNADDATSLSSDWAFTMPVSVGDQVEADLGGAFFPATITRAVSSGTYDVAFFDGDRETGLTRRQIKLLSPPPLNNKKVATAIDAVDVSKMTAKQLKRWKKEQEKLAN